MHVLSRMAQSLGGGASDRLAEQALAQKIRVGLATTSTSSNAIFGGGKNEEDAMLPSSAVHSNAEVQCRWEVKEVSTQTPPVAECQSEETQTEPSNDGWQTVPSKRRRSVREGSTQTPEITESASLALCRDKLCQIQGLIFDMALRKTLPKDEWKLIFAQIERSV